MKTPKTDTLLMTLGEPIDSRDPRVLLCRDLETDLKLFSRWNADLFSTLEYLHSAIEDDDNTLHLALARSRREVNAARGIFPETDFEVWWKNEGADMEDSKEACRTAWENGQHTATP